MMSALYAQKSLNGHYLKDIAVRLFVNWCNPAEEDYLTKEDLQFLQTNNQKDSCSLEMINNWNKEADSQPIKPKPLPNLPLHISVNFYYQMF